MEDRRHIFNRPITLLGFMVSVKIRTHFHAVVRRMIVGKVVIYKALHKGNVNYKLMVIERSTSVRIAEPLRNEDCSTAICLHLWQFINENKCITVVRIQP